MDGDVRAAGSCTAAGRPQAEPLQSLRPGLKMLGLEGRDSQATAMLAAVSWEEAEDARIMGAGAGEDPVGHEASSSVMARWFPRETLERFVKSVSE